MVAAHLKTAFHLDDVADDEDRLAFCRVLTGRDVTEDQRCAFLAYMVSKYGTPDGVDEEELLESLR